MSLEYANESKKENWELAHSSLPPSKCNLEIHSIENSNDKSFTLKLVDKEKEFTL